MLGLILRFIASLVPAAVLCGFVYYKDRVEKEPASLLLLLLLAGAVIYVPIYYLQMGFYGLLNQLFAEKMSFTNEGLILFSNASSQRMFTFLKTFVGAAAIGEVLKWAALLVVTKRNKNFNSLFDGIIYAVFLSFGFSVSDSVLYALHGDWNNLLPRALDVIPVNIFLGLAMGLFYTLWHAYGIAYRLEQLALEKGLITEKALHRPVLLAALSLFVPVVFHGVYALTAVQTAAVSGKLYYVCLTVFYLVSLVLVEVMSRKDSETNMVAAAIMKKKHPGCFEEKEAEPDGDQA